MRGKEGDQGRQEREGEKRERHGKKGGREIVRGESKEGRKRGREGREVREVEKAEGGRMEGGNTINDIPPPHTHTHTHTHTHMGGVAPHWPPTVYPRRGTRSHCLRSCEPTRMGRGLASEKLLESSLYILLPEERVDCETLAQ